MVAIGSAAPAGVGNQALLYGRMGREHPDVNGDGNTAVALRDKLPFFDHALVDSVQAQRQAANVVDHNLLPGAHARNVDGHRPS